MQWVGEKDWTYKTSFETPKSSSDFAFTDLVFDGLDTFATVSLNGVEILKADNMFVSYRVTVTENLKPAGEKNELEIFFRSALIRGRELVEEHKSEHNFLVRQTEAGRLPTRKAQYNWGWDWGPVLMTAGPWKPVYLEQYTARVEDVWVQSQVGLRDVSGSIFVTVQGNSDSSDRVILTLSWDGKPVIEKEITLEGQKGKHDFEISDAALWYPFGYGPQSRYKLEAKLIHKGQVASTQRKLVGFRRAELIQEPDSHGKSFYFRINNVDVFAGGSCWIPTDSYQADISEQRCRDWIDLMVESNQIMLRVWGGGVYEHDALLDACDEKGVLLWHDFQFACGSYPTYDSYLQNLEVECRQQIRRFRTHPSMVIWAGNNEDYQVQERYKLDYNYDSDKDPESWRKSTFPARYLYEHFLPDLIGQEDPHMIYHPSSPWGDGKPTSDASVGDIHQWNLWHGAMNKYQEVSLLGGRFVSEFGMEAYPHLSTINRMVTEPSQRFPGSMLMDHHNKAIGHERRMMTYIVENFLIPPSFSLGVYTHLTQVVQAETMRYAYKIWRRDWAGRKCGGVLVWQLNDCWPTISWAVVDYYLVRKPAFYAIKHAMAELDVCVMRKYEDWTQTEDLVDENSGLKTGQVDFPQRIRRDKRYVWVASSRTEAVEAKVVLNRVSVKHGSSDRIEYPVTIEPNTTTWLHNGEDEKPSIPDSEDITKRFDINTWDPKVIYATLIVNGQVVSRDAAWPEPIKFLDMTDRGVSFDTSVKGQIRITSKRPVKGFVFEEEPGMKLSDNGFDVVGEDVVVKVEGVQAEELKYTYIGAPGSSLSVK